MTKRDRINEAIRRDRLERDSEQMQIDQKCKLDTLASESETPAAVEGAAGSALADVEAALKLVKDSYIHDNKHRLGALGCADMDMVEEYLSCARGKLLNVQAERSADNEKGTQ